MTSFVAHTTVDCHRAYELSEWWKPVLGYVDLEELVAATTVPKDDLCRACFDGVYPVELPDPEDLGKHLLELEPTLAVDPQDGPAGLSLTRGAGASDALDRP